MRSRSAAVVAALSIASALAPRVAAAQDDEELAQPAQPPPAAEPSSAPPPPYAFVPAEEPPPETPKYALWTGARLGLLAFGSDFYENENQHPEVTGNFIRNGLGVEVDVGARLARRYIPYVGVELGLHKAGHRFEGTNASAYSTFFGIGFRSIWVDLEPDTAGLLTDLSFGIRTVGVTNGGESYKMTALELFRLGIGAEIRLSRVFTISPMLTLSGGAMNHTSGSISYAPGQLDGLSHPTYQNGAAIDQQRGYLVVNLGCGAHFDLFGKYR